MIIGCPEIAVIKKRKCFTKHFAFLYTSGTSGMLSSSFCLEDILELLLDIEHNLMLLIYCHPRLRQMGRDGPQVLVIFGYLVPTLDFKNYCRSFKHPLLWPNSLRLDIGLTPLQWHRIILQIKENGPILLRGYETYIQPQNIGAKYRVLKWSAVIFKI